MIQGVIQGSGLLMCTLEVRDSSFCIRYSTKPEVVMNVSIWYIFNMSFLQATQGSMHCSPFPILSSCNPYEMGYIDSVTGLRSFRKLHCRTEIWTWVSSSPILTACLGLWLPVAERAVISICWLQGIDGPDSTTAIDWTCSYERWYCFPAVSGLLYSQLPSAYQKGY